MMNLYTKKITTQSEMVQFVAPVWTLLSEAYENVKGGLNFDSKQDLIDSTCQWKIVFSGKKILAVTIYKAKKGLKLVAMATNKLFKSIAKPALIQLIKNEIKHCWMELSEAAEHFVLKYCNGRQHMINKSQISALLNKSISLDSDDHYHYYRTIKNIRKQKIIVGNPNFMQVC
ncbi:hypothetical protein [Psychromonas arctica]|uniref:hypothetical protein n=1 Tax=Psychromonas arctica TaxID=168275 RepID=UPI002FCF4C9A